MWKERIILTFLGLSSKHFFIYERNAINISSCTLSRAFFPFSSPLYCLIYIFFLFHSFPYVLLWGLEFMQKMSPYWLTIYVTCECKRKRKEDKDRADVFFLWWDDCIMLLLKYSINVTLDKFITLYAHFSYILLKHKMILWIFLWSSFWMSCMKMRNFWMFHA